MYINKLLSYALLFTFLAAFTVSCNMTGSDSEAGQDDVKLQFKTAPSTSSKTVSSDQFMSNHDSLVVEGSNGTLKVNDIRFIVEEFMLEPKETDEEEDSLDIVSEEFEAGPFWVDLPLGRDTLSLATSRVQSGMYEELEFKVEDLNLEEEEEEDGDAGEHQALADSIRMDYPDWPDEASMVVRGSFNPSDGNSRSFKVFANAEIEIERNFNPPLEITEDNVQEVLSIRLNPVLWFKRADGTVRDLSAYDWEQTGQLIKFEAEFERGVEEVETGEEPDDDDSDDDSDD